MYSYIRNILYIFIFVCYNIIRLKKCKSYCKVEKYYIMYTAYINLEIIKKKVTRKKKQYF